MTRTIDLDPSLEAFIQSQLAIGRYATADEMIHEALRHLRDHDAEQLDAELLQSLEEAERGEAIDAEIVFAELRRGIDDIAERRSKR